MKMTTVTKRATTTTNCPRPGTPTAPENTYPWKGDDEGHMLPATRTVTGTTPSRQRRMQRQRHSRCGSFGYREIRVTLTQMDRVLVVGYPSPCVFINFSGESGPDSEVCNVLGFTGNLYQTLRHHASIFSRISLQCFVCQWLFGSLCGVQLCRALMENRGFSMLISYVIPYFSFSGLLRVYLPSVLL